MVNYIILYKKFVEHHVIKLILLKISKLSARLTQAVASQRARGWLNDPLILCLTNVNPSN